MSSRRLQNTIENPTLELKIVSASDINHIDATDKIDIYAVVSIDGHTTQKKQSAKTPIDYDGGSNPTWNHIVKFSVNEREAKEDLVTIKVKLYSYWLENENDLYIGEVNISVHDLLASNPLPPSNGNVNKMKSLTYPLKFIGETKPNSKLTLSYRFKPVPVHDLYPQPSAPPDYLPSFNQPVYTKPTPARSSHPIIYSPQFQTTPVTSPTKLALELVIKSAKDIRNVNVFDDMDVYASVMIREGNTTLKKTKTPIAYSGFISPTWYHTVMFSFDEVQLARKGHLSLFVELMSYRPVMGDKHIGEVKVPIKELIDSNPPSPLNDPDMKLVTKKVTVPTGVKGTLSFTYRFLKEQVMSPIVPGTIPQPYIVYIPVDPHQSYGSVDQVHETSGYLTVQPGTHNLHGYQQYSQPQPQPLSSQVAKPQQQVQQQLSQNSQSQLQMHQSHGRHQYSQSQIHQSHGRHQYSPSQSKLHALPQVKPEGETMAAVGLGVAGILGRVMGEALISNMIS